MKTINILTLSALLLFVGCATSSSTEVELGEGSVIFNCEASSTVNQTTRSTCELPSDLIPAVEDFSLEISGEYIDSESLATESYNTEYQSISDYNEAAPMIPAGNYQATISHGTKGAEGASCALFSGSTTFEVIARKEISKSITASLTNSAIQVQTTEWFDNYYSDVLLTITTAAGNSFDFTSNDEQLIFVDAASEITLKGSATKAQTGTTVEWSESVIGTTEAQTLSTITVDASQAGGATISITFDQTLTEVTLDDTELNPEV